MEETVAFLECEAEVSRCSYLYPVIRCGAMHILSWH